MTKKIYYKNYIGQWEASTLKPTKKNLEYVKKHFALNGQATIQKVK